jgi:hypothetical protein
MRRHIAVHVAGLVAFLAFGPAAFAWNSPGHMLVALIAYDDLAAADRGRVDALVELLRQHPRFREDFLDRMPADLPAAGQGRWLFAHAATWPDMLRSAAPEVRTRYHRASWHYVDKPLALDPKAPAAPEAAALTEADPAKADNPEHMNILQALAHNLTILRDERQAAADRAVALCWVLHLVGDVHQPLHCVTLYSARFPLPQGDRGGNSIPIANDGGISNNPNFAGRGFRPELHGFWDNLPGHSEEMIVLDAGEKHATALYPRSGFRRELQTRDLPAMMDEGYGYAKAAVYAPFILRAVQKVEPPHELPAGERPVEVATLEPISLNDTYIHTARIVAEQRITLAGYRLADQLRSNP